MAAALLWQPRVPDPLRSSPGLGRRASEIDLDAASPPLPTARRARPRVSVEYAPYRSVPLRPGERVRAFPTVPTTATSR